MELAVTHARLIPTLVWMLYPDISGEDLIMWMANIQGVSYDSIDRFISKKWPLKSNARKDLVDLLSSPSCKWTDNIKAAAAPPPPCAEAPGARLGPGSTHTPSRAAERKSGNKRKEV